MCMHSVSQILWRSLDTRDLDAPDQARPAEGITDVSPPRRFAHEQIADDGVEGRTS